MRHTKINYFHLERQQNSTEEKSSLTPAGCFWNETVFLIAGTVTPLAWGSSSAWLQMQTGKGDATSRAYISPFPLASEPVVFSDSYTVSLAFSTTVDGH